MKVQKFGLIYRYFLVIFTPSAVLQTLSVSFPVKKILYIFPTLKKIIALPGPIPTPPRTK
jgi:hypothetical protein